MITVVARKIYNKCSMMASILSMAIYVGCLPAFTQEKFPVDSLFNSAITFKDEKNSDATLKTLAGKPVYITMVYTRCKASCPLMIGKMEKLYRAADERKAEAEFVLVSFDSKHETSETLSKLRVTHKLNGAKWHLWRGDEAAVRELSVLLGINYRTEANGEIVHSNRIVGLDKNGKITVTRDGLDEDLTELLVALN